MKQLRQHPCVASHKAAASTPASCPRLHTPRKISPTVKAATSAAATDKSRQDVNKVTRPTHETSRPKPDNPSLPSPLKDIKTSNETPVKPASELTQAQLGIVIGMASATQAVYMTGGLAGLLGASALAMWTVYPAHATAIATITARKAEAVLATIRKLAYNPYLWQVGTKPLTATKPLKPPATNYNTLQMPKGWQPAEGSLAAAAGKVSETDFVTLTLNNKLEAEPFAASGSALDSAFDEAGAYDDFTLPLPPSPLLVSNAPSTTPLMLTAPISTTTTPTVQFPDLTSYPLDFSQDPETVQLSEVTSHPLPFNETPEAAQFPNLTSHPLDFGPIKPLGDTNSPASLLHVGAFLTAPTAEGLALAAVHLAQRSTYGPKPHIAYHSFTIKEPGYLCRDNANIDGGKVGGKRSVENHRGCQADFMATSDGTVKKGGPLPRLPASVSLDEIMAREWAALKVYVHTPEDWHTHGGRDVTWGDWVLHSAYGIPFGASSKVQGAGQEGEGPAVMPHVESAAAVAAAASAAAAAATAVAAAAVASNSRVAESLGVIVSGVPAAVVVDSSAAVCEGVVQCSAAAAAAVAPSSSGSTESSSTVSVEGVGASLASAEGVATAAPTAAAAAAAAAAVKEKGFGVQGRRFGRKLLGAAKALPLAGMVAASSIMVDLF